MRLLLVEYNGYSICVAVEKTFVIIPVHLIRSRFVYYC